MSQVRWFSPSPLWDDLVRTPPAFRAPQLLRFAGDDFVPRYQAVLETEPRQLRAFVARPETWREPAAGLDAKPSPKLALRLYQPVHGRFYMVAASLACRVPGLPEHTVDAAKGEVVAFVLRRITTTVDAKGKETEAGEWAWVKRADGTEGWVPATAAALAADEETIPMFASTFAGTGGLKGVITRRVFAGLIPASRRETYANGREVTAQAKPAPPAPGSLDDPRVLDFQNTVTDPWGELKDWYDTQKVSIASDPADTLRGAALSSAEQSSALLLIDLYAFCETHLPKLAEALKGTRNKSTLPTQQRAIYDELEKAHAVDRSGASRATLVEAIRHALGFRAQIEALAAPNDLPAGYVRRVLIGDPLKFVAGTVTAQNPTPPPVASGHAVLAEEAELQRLIGDRLAPPWELAPAPGFAGVGVRRLKKLVMDALAVAGPAPAAAPEQLPTRAPANVQGDDWFAVRCVYLRPHCGRRSPPVVSERSERFQLTSFFEPDAPARHLKVALPVDTSPATLRKYNRNVAFVLSDQLRKQMSRVGTMKDLVDGKLKNPDGGISFGVICSFSIPIITICALILLMILVSLLNIIFWWIPLFKICFPVPKLKS